MQTKMLINGEMIEGEGEYLSIISPFDAKHIVDVRSASSVQVDAAVAAAREAFFGWWQTPPGERARMLNAVADHLQSEADKYVRLECDNTGKPFFVTRNFADLPAAVDVLRFLAQNARNLSGPAANEYLPGHLSMVRREPIGVVALNPPWNYPLLISVNIMAAALATGNTVVMKPADPTPLSMLALAEAMNEILPKGVFNLVLGRGAVVGAQLASHKGVDMVQVTGSTETGRAVLMQAAVNVKRTHLELGGKAPVIICKDADIKLAVEELRLGSFANAGQDCTQACRVYVEKSIYDKFVADFASMAKSIRFGTDNDEENEMAPLFTEAHFKRVSAAVDAAAALPHTEVVAGGKAGPRGFFYEPTVIAGARQRDDVVQKEIFGPVVSVTPFDSIEEAIELANDCDFGLASSVFSQNTSTALDIVRQLRFGVTWVNTHFPMASEMPHGGLKQTGYGTDGSVFSLEDYTTPRHVMIKFANAS